MATHSSILAWKIPWTGEPGELLSIGPYRVGHNWSDLAAAAAEVVPLSPNTGLRHRMDSRLSPGVLLCPRIVWAMAKEPYQFFLLPSCPHLWKETLFSQPHLGEEKGKKVTFTEHEWHPVFSLLLLPLIATKHILVSISLYRQRTQVQ